MQGLVVWGHGVCVRCASLVQFVCITGCLHDCSLLSGDVQIQNGALLSIDPGVSVYMGPDARLLIQSGNGVFGTGMLFIKARNGNGEDVFAYYHHDHLGTPIQATDKAGRIVWAASYEAFGRATITTPEATPAAPVLNSNLRLPGQYEDEESGLYYNWNRYYDPQTGRYISSDPIGLNGRINTYAYANSTPTLFTDPLGLATDGQPLNSMNCEALLKIVDYEKKHGKFNTVMAYNPLNFSSDAVSLDAAYPSLGGPVSIDWMMRSGGFGITTLPGLPMFTYSLGKQVNNLIHRNNPYTNIGGEANLNSPSAMSYWYYGENGTVTLEKMFAPAIKECKCKEI